MTDVVVFIDALTPRELKGVLSDWHQGNMDSGTPRVTPRVMSSIYTGLDPAENGMLEVSKYGGGDVTRPMKSTFIEQAVRDGKRVYCNGMPFCIPFNCQIEQDRDGLASVLHGTALRGSEQVIPQEAGQLVSVVGPTGEMIKDHPDNVYASFHDYTHQFFNTVKEGSRAIDADVVFAGFRLIDSYCHFQHLESRNGKPFRQHLIDHIQSILSTWYSQIDGDIMFFSDHGQTNLGTTFRVNKWLYENDWLEYKVDYDFISTFSEWQSGEQHPVEERVENQVTFGQPGVTLVEEESQVICDDPFDSCLTLVCDRDEFDEEGFREELMGTGMYRSVDYKWELYDESADHYDHIPDIIPDRAEGVFVSGNIHKDPIGMGYYRTGVHDRTACFGATKPLNIPEGEVKPEDMYDVICDFIGLDRQPAPISPEDLGNYTQEELKQQEELIKGVLE